MKCKFIFFILFFFLYSKKKVSSRFISSPFHLASNPRVSCKSSIIPYMDLTKWAEPHNSHLPVTIQQARI